MSNDDLDNSNQADQVYSDTDIGTTKGPIKYSASKDIPAKYTPTVVDPLGNNFAYAILYALVLLICGFSLFETAWGLIPIFAFTGSTIFLVAAWSVLGSGPYWKRMLIAHLIGTIPAIGLMIPALSSTFLRNTGDANVVLGIAISVVPLSLGAQMVFWFLRGVLGWQLVPRGRTREVAYTIRDIFVVTFIVAATLGVAQFYATTVANGTMNDWAQTETVELDENGEIVYDQNGDMVFREMDVEEQQAERNQNEQMVRSSTLMGFAFSLVMASVLTAVSVPILPRLFLSGSAGDGCGAVAVYLFIVASIPLGLFFVIGSVFGGMPDINMVSYGIFSVLAVVFGFGLAVWMPLLSSREKGVQLITNSRIKQIENESAKKIAD